MRDRCPQGFLSERAPGARTRTPSPRWNPGDALAGRPPERQRNQGLGRMLAIATRWHAGCDDPGLSAAADATRPSLTGDRPMNTTGDLDPGETSEWIDALSAVQQHRGSDRAG